MDYVSLLEYKIKSELRDCIGYLDYSHDLVLVENTDGLSLYLDHICLCGDLPKRLVPQECWGIGSHKLSSHQAANIIFPIPSAVLIPFDFILQNAILTNDVVYRLGQSYTSDLSNILEKYRSEMKK